MFHTELETQVNTVSIFSQKYDILDTSQIWLVLHDLSQIIFLNFKKSPCANVLKTWVYCEHRTTVTTSVLFEIDHEK